MGIFAHRPRRFSSQPASDMLPKFSKIRFAALLKRSDSDKAEIAAQRAHRQSFYKRPHVPTPIPPHLETAEQFLGALGRNLVNHASKFASWDAFFKTTSSAMEKLGIGCRERKYILAWQYNFR
ncbi:telomere length regulation protein [Mitosporidium daphniae]|uniref:Small ribosomal subunit protein mS41 n=1 Tax=Mitosporidium daphniae TaxID=1485682 RepID=A0A098VS60_9MICR|nr:uncharacterized protein DI09_26p270 [Mitosporidium daphniae]KGG51827.1 hypothetical protein DI09_26p270 [Mitosporidium daphniae]|eukprot:XP_013238254.1 uncharacterized protein DI09_26p270 [Mitosporidium daphniae]